MRYALLTVGATVGPWSAFHYVMAGRSIDDDLERTDDLELPAFGWRKLVLVAAVVVAALVLVIYRYTSA